MDLNRLPIELEQFVQQEIAEGKYQSAEEVVSAALRLLQEHESQGYNGHQSVHCHGGTKSHSADDVLQAISHALATGKPGLARKLASEGIISPASRPPNDSLLDLPPVPCKGDVVQTLIEERNDR